MGSEAELLAAWETARRFGGRLRSAVATAVLDGDPRPGDAVGEPLGAVAARAARLAAEWFGDEIDASTICSRCGADLEVTVPGSELVSLGADVDPRPFTFTVGDAAVTARLPTPDDLDAAARSPIDTARAALATRCLDGIGDGSLGDDDLERFAAELERRDPLGVVQIDLTCPDCGTATVAVLDVLDWWWTRIDAHAGRIMLEVHRLARAYGWSEAESLAVGPARRATYLELVG